MGADADGWRLYLHSCLLTRLRGGREAAELRLPALDCFAAGLARVISDRGPFCGNSVGSARHGIAVCGEPVDTAAPGITGFAFRLSRYPARAIPLPHLPIGRRRGRNQIRRTLVPGSACRARVRDRSPP